MLTRTLTRSDESSARHFARCLILSVLGAALTSVGSRIAIPFWPVPLTLQVFFVLLCGAALGPRWGAAAQAQYVAAGAMGLPIFAAGRGGPSALLGPTGGYLVGFVAAACVTGWLTERSTTAIRRRIPGASAVPYAATLAGAAVIWLCGWLWLAVWSSRGGEPAPLRQAFIWGVAPFVAADVVKATAAAAAGRLLRRTTGAQD
jgi:biotin transport system substrate-specific component